jgi:Fe-Mn family superoxide dismutase
MIDYDFRIAAQSRYILPPLPFDPKSISHIIPEQILSLHHDKHHQSYVDGLNENLDQLQEAREKKDFTHLKGIERNLAFNYSGHILHTLYWNCIDPSNTILKGLQERLVEDFGSVESFKEQFIEAGTKAEGSAWVCLAEDQIANQLMINVIENHQNQSLVNAKVLFTLDVWEHAYYLKYFNDRKKYLEAALSISI